VSLVLHSSVVIAWYFEDGGTAETDTILDRVADDGAVVPEHWRLDIAEAFQKAIQQNRTDAIYRDASLAELALLPITIDADTNTYAWSVYRPRLLRHLAEAYAARATGSSCCRRKAAGGMNPCRSMSQMVL
jgi:hypothetical protein